MYNAGRRLRDETSYTNQAAGTVYINSIWGSLLQDPHLTHFSELRSNGQVKDYGADNHLPNFVIMHTLIFTDRALYASSPFTCVS